MIFSLPLKAGDGGRRHLRLGRTLLVAVFLMVAIGLIFSPVSDYGFLDQDDDKYVTQNPQVLEGLSARGFLWAFTSMGYASNWHPLTWLSHMTDVQLFGANPRWHHRMNVLFHSANTLLLFFLLRTMTGAFWRSAFTAAFFGVHPLHVESVAWISERKDVLSTFFFMLTLGAYCWYSRKPVTYRFLTVILCFALGLLAKPMLVTLPFVLFLLDFWPLRRLSSGEGALSGNPEGGNLKRLIMEKVPLLTMSAASGVLTYAAQSRGDMVASLGQLPLAARISNISLSYAGYLWKTIWPAKLAFFYPFPAGGPSPARAAAAGILLLVISAAAARLVRRVPYLWTGWGWYLVTLTPVIGLVQVGEQAMANRYTYVPIIGCFLIITWGIHDMVGSSPFRGRLAAFAGVAALAALIVVARIHVGYWQNGTSLFTHDLEVTTENWMAENNLGVIDSREGRTEAAVRHLRQAIRIQPSFIIAHNNLGVALAKQGKYDEALAHYREAIRINPEYAAPYYNTGMIFLKQAEVEKALFNIRKALQLKYDFPDAHFTLGTVLEISGRTDAALHHYREALRFMPSHAGAKDRLDVLLNRRATAPDGMP